MGSRIRDNVEHLFECFCEVSPGGNDLKPSIIRKFPDTYNIEEELKELPKFTFPCEFENSLVQHYSFVLTSADSKYTFCFCRYDSQSKTSLVLLSHLPWHDAFFKVLNFLSPFVHINDNIGVKSFLTALRIRPPTPGHAINITYNAGYSVFTCECPESSLPTIPENNNLTEFFSALDSKCMAGLWAALLHERRVAVVATKPSRLSATVQAANAILYPMTWQHIFIPILPKHLVDYLLAPMPFLIGVPRSVMEHVRLSEVGDVVILDADANELRTPFNDLEALPGEVVSTLRRALSDKDLLGDGVARAFLRALVYLIGGYRNAIRIEKRKIITFNPEEFVKTRRNMQPFLQKILESQIFQQFIEERLELLNAGRGFSDEFEVECYNFAEKASGGSGQRLKQQYKDWSKAMKREGGAILKTVKDKANPAVKSAVDSVRQGGRNVKSAVKGFRMKMPKQGSPSSSSNTMDDSRFSYGSATAVSSGSSDSLRSQSSSRSAPLTSPVLPLDLLNEMQLRFSGPEATSTPTNKILGPHASSQPQCSGPVAPSTSGTMIGTISQVPPHLPQRPSIRGRYPIVPTTDLVNLSILPELPPMMNSLNYSESSQPLPTNDLRLWEMTELAQLPPTTNSFNSSESSRPLPMNVLSLWEMPEQPQLPPEVNSLDSLESSQPLPTNVFSLWEMPEQRQLPPNSLNSSELPQLPPRAGIARGNSQFSSEIMRSERTSKSSASAMHFPQVFPDGKRLEAAGVTQRKLSLWKMERRAPIRTGDNLQASPSAGPSVPPLQEPAGTRLRPIPKPAVVNVPLKEASDSSPDLIVLLDSAESAGSHQRNVEDFDPLRRNIDSAPVHAGISDRELLQEYGLDFSRYGIHQAIEISSTDDNSESQSRASVPEDWTTFN